MLCAHRTCIVHYHSRHVNSVVIEVGLHLHRGIIGVLGKIGVVGYQFLAVVNKLYRLLVDLGQLIFTEILLQLLVIDNHFIASHGILVLLYDLVVVAVVAVVAVGVVIARHVALCGELAIVGDDDVLVDVVVRGKDLVLSPWCYVSAIGVDYCLEVAASESKLLVDGHCLTVIRVHCHVIDA